MTNRLNALKRGKGLAIMELIYFQADYVRPGRLRWTSKLASLQKPQMFKGTLHNTKRLNE